MTDPCAKERQELDAAMKLLSDHRQNPLEWDTSSEEYKNRLAELLQEVEEKEKALKKCEAGS